MMQTSELKGAPNELLETAGAKTKIRVAKKGDFRSIIKLSEKSWPGWWSGNKRLGAEHIKSRINARNTLVAVANGRVVGYMSYGVLWSLLHLEDIFVDPEYRRAGLGSEMLGRLIALGKRKRYRKIISDADTDNLVSYRFHISNGFKKVGYIKDLWGGKDSFVFAMSLKRK